MVIQSSSDPITMEQLCENFICNFVVEEDQQMVVVEMKTISNPLCLQELQWSFKFLLLCSTKEEVGMLFWREDSF
jgi:hypothetical protein